MSKTAKQGTAIGEDNPIPVYTEETPWPQPRCQSPTIKFSKRWHGNMPINRSDVKSLGGLRPPEHREAHHAFSTFKSTLHPPVVKVCGPQGGRKPGRL